MAKVSRFIDQKDITRQKDFVRRKYGYDGIYIVLLLTASWLLCMGAYSAFRDGHESVFYAVITLIFIGCGGALYAFIRNDRDTMHALEFQNALFAATTRQHSDFYAILSHSGNVVYIHPDYHRRLNHLLSEGSDTLEALCEIISLTPEKKALLLRLLTEGKKGTFNFTATAQDEKQPLNMLLQPIHMCTAEEYHRDITLVLEPISRPSGFFLLAAEKESPYSTLVKNLDKLHVGYFIADARLQFTSASVEFAGAGGYTKAELTEGMHLTDLFPILTKEYIDETDTQHGTITKILPVLCKDGIERNRYITVITATHDEHHQPVYIGIATRYDPISTLHDFSMDDTSAAAIFQHSPIAAVVTSGSGHILYANTMFRSALQLSAGDALPDTLPECIDDDMTANVADMLQRTASHPENGAQQLRADILSGDESHPRFFTAQAIPSQDDAQEPYIAVYMTENDGAVRLAECAAHSQKMQAVGQLAGGIAHDFNNLLTAMLGFCDMLLERHPAGDESFSDIMQVRQNANRAAGLVRQLLAFSRRQTLRPQIIDITDIVADLSDLLNRLLGENIRPDIRHGYHLHPIRVDIGQLEQVIVNLAVNARDAMNDHTDDGKEGILTVVTENVDLDARHPIYTHFSPENDQAPYGSYVMLTVKDNGTGIPQDALHNIFEPFFSTKEIGEGTGLGLATVFGIVKQNNGYIYVETGERKGTIFYILFPRHHKTENDAIETVPIEDTPSLVGQDTTGKGTILLVEDEAPVRMFSASALKSKGYTVLEAENGFEALDVMEESGSTIDLIITDVMMPGMSGPSFIENILPDYPDIKVIFISGYAEDQFMEQFKDKRLVDFLPKPYSLKQLAVKVKTMAA